MANIDLLFSSKVAEKPELLKYAKVQEFAAFEYVYNSYATGIAKQPRQGLSNKEYLDLLLEEFFELCSHRKEIENLLSFIQEDIKTLESKETRNIANDL